MYWSLCHYLHLILLVTQRYMFFHMFSFYKRSKLHSNFSITCLGMSSVQYMEERCDCQFLMLVIWYSHSANNLLVQSCAETWVSCWRYEVKSKDKNCWTQIIYILGLERQNQCVVLVLFDPKVHTLSVIYFSFLYLLSHFFFNIKQVHLVYV